MIKANGLKPGDLVRVCGDNWQIKKGTICEILSIDLFYKYCSELDWVTVYNPNSYIDKVRLICKDIEGIPLTPEILEKNGWKRDKLVSYIYGHEAHFIEVICTPNSEWVYVTFKGETIHRIKYVHELQHILWALGLDAELKIE